MLNHFFLRSRSLGFLSFLGSSSSLTGSSIAGLFDFFSFFALRSSSLLDPLEDGLSLLPLELRFRVGLLV
jgi:hypothetical protein